MAGFMLPRLRWLVIGALAAGAWAMTQEPPKREHWQRQRTGESASVENKKPTESTPALAAAPAPKPSPMVTSSIPRPERPVARAEAETLRTTEKVRLRKEASTASPVVAMLKAGQALEATATDGKWRKVAVDGMVGWVHSDYLTARRPRPTTEMAAVPRPRADVAPISEPAAAIPAVASPADKSIWGAMRPARAPQGGDCQCPYDIMLNGQQCGERSAYARGKGAECYF
jgi:uncharacterized protein YraI